MENASKGAGASFKSLRDYILWELNSDAASTPLMSLDDDPESSQGVTRWLRGKMRYLSDSAEQKRA